MQKKVNLENLRKQKLQGHFVRSHARWIEQREKATKFWVSKLFEQNYQRVKLEGKEIIYKQSSILNYVKEYYEILYTSIKYWPWRNYKLWNS